LATDLVVLLEDFVALQGGELPELQTHDRLGLGLGHAIAGLDADFFLQAGKIVDAQGAFQKARAACLEGRGYTVK